MCKRKELAFQTASSFLNLSFPTQIWKYFALSDGKSFSKIFLSNTNTKIFLAVKRNAAKIGQICGSHAAKSDPSQRHLLLEERADTSGPNAMPGIELLFSEFGCSGTPDGFSIAGTGFDM